jgi:hypothetical protein
VAPQFNINMLLADHAEAVNGKLYINGGGWSMTGPNPSPFAIAVSVKVPWEMANRRHQLRLELVDSEGRPVEFPTPDGSTQPLVLEPELEVGRPAGLVPGTPLDAALAINFSPLPLDSGRYEWRLMVNGECEEDWTLPFTVRAAQPGAQAATG